MQIFEILEIKKSFLELRDFYEFSKSSESFEIFKGIERFHFAILEMTVKFFAIFSGILKTFLRIRMCLNIARFFQSFSIFFWKHFRFLFKILFF